jgi:RNA-directed DNA polymerase
MAFDAAICCKAKAYIKQRIRDVFNPRNTTVSLEQAAIKLNPKIRGWLNYYSRFNAITAQKVFVYLNELIQRWFSEKFRLRGKMATLEKYKIYVHENRKLFVHWQKGITY